MKVILLSVRGPKQFDLIREPFRENETSVGVKKKQTDQYGHKLMYFVWFDKAYIVDRN